MCVLPDMNYFVVGTTERDLIFYDINSHTYTGSIIINHFPANLTTIDYRMDMKNSSQSAIFCGDSLGNLFIFQTKDQYKPMFHISDLTYNKKTESIRNYSFLRIINNEYLTVSIISFYNLHYDWIVQIKWINDLNLFVSCALTSKKSLYIGDLNKKTEKYAAIKKGFSVFDYCKAHRSIVTGGNDGIIYFWDPFFTERTAAILRGHNSSITHLVIDNQDDHIISIDKGKSKIFHLLS
jgi:WD40 repeat protein